MKALNDWFARLWIRIIKSMAHTPIERRAFYARIIASVLWYAIPKRRKVTLTNLRLCFPEKTEAERVEIAKSTYRHLARAALDHGVLWAGTAEEVDAMVRFDGIKEMLESSGFRVEIDERNEKVGRKIRDAQMEKVPYMLIVGDKDIVNNTVSPRHRTDGDLGPMGLFEFTNLLKKAVDSKTLK